MSALINNEPQLGRVNKFIQMTDQEAAVGAMQQLAAWTVRVIAVATRMSVNAVANREAVGENIFYQIPGHEMEIHPVGGDP